MNLIDTFTDSYEGRPISDLLSQILNESGYEKALRTEGSQERLDNLAELKQSIYDFEATCGEETDLPHYLSHIALFTNADVAEQQEKVKLMTVHAAKGLEFPHVILCGMNEGIFPSRRIRTRQEMEEERRLAFVAMTRAEKSLTLTMSDGLNIDGSPRYPSRFVLDIDQELLDYTKPPQEGLIRMTRDYIRRKDEIMDRDSAQPKIAPGMRVSHAIFGEGEVISVDHERRASQILFDGMDTPRTISFRVNLQEIPKKFSK